MSAIEGSMKPLLLGVSQQVARERLEGQVAAQDNMLSDGVTGLRRRPGLGVEFNLAGTGATASNVVCWHTDIGGSLVHVLLNGGTGVLTVLDQDFTVVATVNGGTYLQASRNQLQTATIGNELFILNSSWVVGASRTGVAFNRRRGFFFVRLGAFSKRYSVTVKVDGTAREYSYTTPDGTSAGDAALSSAERIAAELRDAIYADLGVSGVDVRTAGACIYLLADTSVNQLVVTTDASDTYMVASNNQTVRMDTNLPPSLHSAADGLIIKTGADKAAVYYRYDYDESAWVEDGAPGSVFNITNMPRALRKNPDTSAWELVTGGFEGRLAGDDETNPDPEFIGKRLTGIGSYQNRLVLLSGSIVALSSSDNPRRFYRTTTTTLLASDAIHIGASGNSSAEYQYCLQFQKDLLLFSEQYQALIPSGNSAIKPDTATVVITSTYTADMTSPPVSLGRTVMYPFPRSGTFFGMMEMLPSPYTDSQYVSQDTTQHLPKYMPQRCRFGVSSSVANMALFAPTGDARSLLVHEYLWSGDEKVQQAWHRWTLPYPVADAYFANDRVIVVFVRSNRIIGCVLDPRQGDYTEGGDRRPFMDMYVFADVADNLVSLPSFLTAFDSTVADKIKLCRADGDLAGEAVGFETTDTPGVLRTVGSFPDGRVAIGIPYRSSVSLTPPFIRDKNGVVVSTNKLTLLRYVLTTANSAEYEVAVSDAYGDLDTPGDTGTLYWSSPELELGQPLIAGTSVAVVPMRTLADRTSVSVYTDGLGELNLLGVEYVARYLQRLKRR